jgi:hypothetical protein
MAVGLVAPGFLADGFMPAARSLAGAAVRPVLAAGGAPRPAVALLQLTARGADVVTATPPASLVAPDLLGAGVAVTRAHGPSSATSAEQDATGSWVEVGQNLPRFAFPSRRLSVPLRAGANQIRNPRGAGAVAGAPGTLPTNWQVTTNVGLSREVVAAGTTGDGRPFVDIRFSGTVTSGNGAVIFENGLVVAAVTGQTWTLAADVGLVAGSAPTGFLTFQLAINELNVGGTALLTNLGGNILPSITAAQQRFTYTVTTTQATTAWLRPFLRTTFVSSGAVDFTLRFTLPQIEQSPAATQPILPPVGSPQATTRALDLPVWTPSAWPQRGAILLRGVVPALAGASVLGLVQIDGGSDTNRIVARIAAGGGQPEALAITGGVTVATLSPTGPVVAGAPFAALLAWSPGAVRFATSTGGVLSAAVARPPSLSRAVLGHADAAGTLPLGGELLADFYSFWPSESEALALVGV